MHLDTAPQSACFKIYGIVNRTTEKAYGVQSCHKMIRKGEITIFLSIVQGRYRHLHSMDAHAAISYGCLLISWISQEILNDRDRQKEKKMIVENHTWVFPIDFGSPATVMLIFGDTRAKQQKRA